MKKLLLSTVALAATFAVASAATPLGEAKTTTLPVNTRVVKNGVNADKKVKQLAPGVTVTTERGFKKLNNMYGAADASVIKPSRAAIARATPPEGYVLFESFEGCDLEDENWVPEGWTVEMNGNVKRAESWGGVMGDGFYLPKGPDGDYYFSIFAGSKDQDEWLISPYVEVADKMDLTYWLYMQPMWLFVIDSNHIDWTTRDFIGEPEVAATLQIWAQAEGEDWVMLRDYADEYKDMSFKDLEKINPRGLEENQVGLENYYGKKTRVAFRYVGFDGGIMFVDAIGIGYPAIENVSFLNPFDMQYWGLLRSPFLQALDVPVGVYPVNVPITWMNSDVDPDLTYTWTYYDPDTDQPVDYTEDPYELTVTYKPNFLSEETPGLNIYGVPSLRADAPEMTPNVFEPGYSALQAGGRAGFDFDGEDYRPTILPFNPFQQGLEMTFIDDTTIRDAWLPVFGYNVNTDQYWLNYSLNGEEEMPGDYSHLIAIANLIWPTNDAPMVVSGLNVYAYAQFFPDAEFTATIYGLPQTEEGIVSNYEQLIPLASKTILGSDVIREDEYNKCYMCLPFDFDEPVVLQATEDIPAFFVMFEGFNSDKVDSFAPFQSEFDDPDGYTKGYIVNHIDLSAHTGMPAYYSTKPMCYVDNGKYVDVAGAFAIGLNAEYPWLTTECEGVELSADNRVAEVALNSYYDASKLTIEAPAGVTAAVEGRYNECVLKVSLDENAGNVAGDIVIKGLGVEISIPVKSSTGINEISVENAEIKAIYDVAGRQVGTAPTPGIYVVKFTNGATRKLVVK